MVAPTQLPAPPPSSLSLSSSMSSSSKLGNNAHPQASPHDAEELFRLKGVPAIREEEKRTRDAVEAKRGELRELVGASYRDLIDSADNIMQMRDAASEVSGCVAKMRESFAELLERASPVGRDGLPPSASAVGGSGHHESKKTRERKALFHVGSRVKYLVDTPEQIYGFLDVGAYVGAAERLLRARHVHSLLTEGSNEELLGRFPLLKVQWPATEALSAQILSRSTAALRRNPAASAHPPAPAEAPPAQRGEDVSAAVSGALAAAVLAGDLDSESALVVLLEAREALLSNAFAAAGDGGEQGSAAAVDAMKELVRIVKGTAGLVAMLFVGSTPALGAAARDGVSRDALFSGMVDVDAEVAGWSAKVEEVKSRMEPLPRSEVAAALRSWLERAVEVSATRGVGVLRNISELDVLARVEKELRDFVASDDSCLAFCRTWIMDQNPDAGGRACGDWGSLCTSLLDEQYDLWDSIIDSVFVERVQELVQARLQSVDMQSELGAALLRPSDGSGSEGTEREGEGPDASSLRGREQDGAGPTDHDASTAEVTLCRKWRGSGGGGKGQRRPGGDRRRSQPHSVHSLRVQLDKQLADVARGVRGVIDCVEDSHGGDARAKRAETLMPLVHRLTTLAVERNLAYLDEILDAVNRKLGAADAVGSDGHGEIGRWRAQALRAVGVGHICRAIANESEVLPILLSPFSAWPSEIRGGEEDQALGRASSIRRAGSVTHKVKSSRAEGTGALMDALKASLMDKSRTAFQIWIDWSVGRAREAFKRDLHADATLQSKSSPISWEKVSIPVKVENDERSEMKLELPGTSSASMLNFLFRASCEMQLAGVGLSSERDITKAYALALRHAAVDVISKSLARGGHLSDSLSEKGRVQVLFDLSLLSDVLAGASSVDDPDGAKSTRAIKAVRASVSDAIDPIDWATYEPHLKRLEEKYYHRTSVLLGEFIYLNKINRGSGTADSGSSANPGGGAVPASVLRFSYLPVSMPVVRSGLGSSRRLTKSLQMSKLAKGGVVGPGDLDLQQLGTSSLLEGDGMSNKTLDFKSFVDSMGNLGNWTTSMASIVKDQL